MVTIDPLSVISIPIFPMYGSVHLSVATGFFYRRDKDIYLVSNWHVMSGRNPKDGQPLDKKNGAVPDSLRLHLHKSTIGHFVRDARLPLLDAQGSPLWRQHHQRGQDIDVAVLPMPKFAPSEDVKFYCVNDEEAGSPLLARVGTDVFIVGFPKGLALQDILPIWKRGTIATEVDVPIENLPLFLVDSATRDGMSGSPVYARSVGFASFENGSSAIGPGVHTRFLGVYSGRYGADDEFSAQVGRVWRNELVDEIISFGVQGTFVLR